MKQFKTILVAVALILTAFIGQAQETKIAHIDVKELITKLPAFIAAQGELQQLGKTYETQFKEMQTELQSTMKRYDAEATQQTDEENQRRVAEVQERQQSIQQFYANAQKQLQEKEVNLLQPILESANKSIQKVGKAKGYSYILDSSAGAGVLLADGYDLMADVKSSLGI